mgnify:CR=1 FL=1
MPDPSSSDPDFWAMAFEQTPKALQWVLAILTLGLFSIAGWAWRREQRNIERVESQIHARMDREMGQLHQRLDDMNYHLIEIAQNTRK